MKSYEDVQRQFDAALMGSEDAPLGPKKSHYEGVRDALGWVLEEYEEAPVEDVEES